MSSSGSKGALGIGGNFTNNNGLNYQQQQQQQYQQYNVVVTNGSINNTCGTNSITTNMGLLHCPNGGGGGSGTGNTGTGGGGGNSSGTGNNSCTNTNNTLGGCGGGTATGGGGGDQSVSEAISNISSPDYQDDDNLLSSRDLLGGMILSDPSDSDSTILVSDAAVQRQQQHQQQRHHQQQQQKSSEHKVVIQVRGADSNANSNSSYNNNGSSMRSLGSDLKNSEDELATLAEDAAGPIMHQQSISPNSNTAAGNLGDGRESSPPVSDDGSDVESLHSYHYSPKAVDMPSAIRLAKRLYTLDGFKKSDVSRHLSKK